LILKEENVRKLIFLAVGLIIPLISWSATEKEWTFLVFMNGHNNLDPYGAADINEMEKVGSTDQVNVVVQWASLQNGDTKRLYVTKDADPRKVQSLIVEEMPAVDMGDYKNLVEFIRWGSQQYPAKKYFITVWNHGSGWHSLKDKFRRGGVSLQDISSDDRTGNVITTEQLGQAMSEASLAIGKKIEIYGSDACLMGMAEVAAEMSESVNYFVGSQELEPADGWHYDRLLAEWTRHPQFGGAEVSSILTRTYLDGYGKDGDGITLSAVNLNTLSKLENLISVLAKTIKNLPNSVRKQILTIAGESQSFFYQDYVDAGDFIKRLTAAKFRGLDGTLLQEVTQTLNQYILSNRTSSSHTNATGVSIWIPTNQFSFDDHSKRYFGLAFHKRTLWGEAVGSLLK